MRLEQLKYFLSIAETQSINKTSLEFYTTHQGISKAIRQLEDEIGAPLFTRSSKGMVLTEEGSLLLPVAKRCVKDLHLVQLEIQHRSRNKDLAGLLTLYGAPLSTSTLLPALLDDYATLYPNVRYQINEANPSDILSYVSLHKNALGLVVLLHNPDFHDLYQPYLDQVRLYPLERDEYLCLVSASSPLAERKSISFQEFATYPVTTILPDASENHPLRQLLQRLGQTDIPLSTSSPRLLVQSIISGKYLAISSRRCREENVLFSDNDVTAIPFDEDLSLDIALATNIHPEFDEISETFVDLVKERSGSPM